MLLGLTAESWAIEKHPQVNQKPKKSTIKKKRIKKKRRVEKEESQEIIKPQRSKKEERQKEVVVRDKEPVIWDMPYIIETAFQTGTLLNESYVKAYLFGAKGGIIFSGLVGIEVEFSLISSAENQDKKELNKLKDLAEANSKTVNINLDKNVVKTYFDYEFFIIPIKAKLISFVLPVYYFDMFFLAGQSQLKTDQGRISALMMGVGQRIYVSYNLSIRMDLKIRFFSEEKGTDEENISRRLVSFGLGVSYML